MDTLHMLMQEFGGMVAPCLVALPFILLCRFLTYRKTGIWNKKREVVVVLFFLYLVAVLSRTLFPDGVLRGEFTGAFRMPNADNTVILTKPVIGWIMWMRALHNTAEIVRNIGGNILLFVPYGFLLPLAFRKHKKLTVLYGLGLTCFIEIAQLFNDRFTDLNDVVMNLLGVTLGYLLFILFYAIINKKKTAYQEIEK